MSDSEETPEAIETGAHPRGGFFATYGGKVARGDTPEDAKANLLAMLGRT